MSVKYAQQSCIDEISRAVCNVFERLDEIEQATQKILHRCTGGARGLISKDFKELHPLLDRQLGVPQTALQGTGVVLEPGLLDDAELHLEWRQRGVNGKTAPLNLNFNRSSDCCYDYLDMVWFSRPREQGGRTIAGPYVDLYGQDMYLLTFSRPIHFEGRFIGVAAADVALSQFESVLMRSLLSIKEDAVLVSEQGRVIAANNANYTVGELARQALNSPKTRRQSLNLGHEGVSWSLLHCSQPSPQHSLMF